MGGGLVPALCTPAATVDHWMEGSVASRITARVPYPSSALPPDPLSVLTLLESTYRANLNSRIQTISVAHHEETHRLTFAGKFGCWKQLESSGTNPISRMKKPTSDGCRTFDTCRHFLS
jgi:hypothetical protein